MSLPGAYPIEEVVHALDEPAKPPTKRIVKVAQKKHFEAQTRISLYSTVHPSTKCSFKSHSSDFLPISLNGKSYLLLLF